MTIQREKAVTTRKIALAAVLAAVAIALSPLVSFPLPLATPFPIQHMVNAIAGVLLGPWYAVLIAVIAGIARYMLGTGTIHAFPGGIFGGLIVGLVYKYIWKKDYAALFEPIGTVLIGAAASAYIFGPFAAQAGLRGRAGTFDAFAILFAPSSIPGCILGFAVLKILRRTRLWT
jgi:energy coupling factor transporter S component ThiW